MKQPDILEKEFQGLMAMAYAPIDKMAVAQVEELRTMFMAGAFAFMTKLMADLDPAAGVTQKDEALLASMSLELEVFYQNYVKGHR